MVGYEANVEAGEEVRVADVGRHPELAALRHDFWLFDAETPGAFAMLMQFDTVGHLWASTSPIAHRSSSASAGSVTLPLPYQCLFMSSPPRWTLKVVSCRE
jgi:hypothetical protein